MKLEICINCKQEMEEHIPAMFENPLLSEVCSQECFDILVQPERLSGKTRKGCDSLNITDNVVREIRRSFPANYAAAAARLVTKVTEIGSRCICSFCSH
jgi:hypothetical protein